MFRSHSPNKPDARLPLDRSDPIARSLTRLWRFDTLADADLVRGSRLTVQSGAPTLELGRFGRVGAVVGGGYNYWTHPAPTELHGAPAFSVVVCHDFTVDVTFACDLFGQWGSSGTADAQQVLRRWTGQYDWSVQNTSLTYATTSFSGGAFVEGVRYTTVFTADGSDLRVYNNGQLVSGPTALAGPYFATDSTTWKIGFAGLWAFSLASASDRWRVYQFGYANRALSHQEAIRLHESPFSIYRRPTTGRLIWLAGLGGAGGATSGAGTATGEATATAVSASLSRGAGSADGAALATGVGASIGRGVGSASGEATAAATGKAIANVVGSALGDASATAVGKAIANAAGSALGEAIATAVGTSSSSGSAVGTAAGDSSASAVGKAIANVIGTAAGDSSASAVGQAIANAAGLALGEATATAVGTSTNQGVGAGSAAGDSTAVAVGRAIVNAVGTAAGSASAEATGAGGLTAALRDRPILRHLAQLLRDTGQFHRVTTTGEVERKGESAEHYKFATLSLTGFTEQAWAGDPDEDTVVQRTVTYQLVIAVRDEDPDCRDDELDRLVQVAHNTLGGRSYSDATESEQSYLTGGRYLPAVSPQREAVLTGQWVQMIDDWHEHYATV